MKRYLASAGLLLATLLLLLPGCKKDTPGGAQLGDLKGKVAGMEWSVPKRWTAMPAREMRVATYAVPKADGDAEDGECYAAFFPGSGGNVEANIERWVGQFESAEVSGKESKEINGLKVSTVQVTGTYSGMGGGMMMGQGVKKEHYRLLGAVVEAPEGLVFFKCTGPSKTVAAAEAEYNTLLQSLKK